MVVIHVERDEITRTKAAEYLGMARSWGVKWYGRYLKGGTARTTDKTAVRQASVCFQEGHEKGVENPEEDHLLDGHGGT